MRALLLASLFLVGGCYKYVPVQVSYEDLVMGTPVRAHMDNGESVDLREYTAHNIVSMNAEFVRLDDSELVLSAMWLDSSTNGVGYPGGGWTVRIPTASVSLLEQKKFDIWRTSALVAAIGAATYLGFDAILGDSGGSNGGEPPIDPR